MKSFKQHINEALKKGDRVVATKNTRGGWGRDMKEVPTIKKGTKGTYHGETQGLDKGYHVIKWDGVDGPGAQSGSHFHGDAGTYAHNRHEFKKA